MLATRIEHQNWQNMPLIGVVIQEKARRLYKDPMKDAMEHMPVATNWEWFEHF
jgi:hypothetical protein